MQSKKLNLLITGVASGIGKASAEYFSGLGNSVYGIDVKESAANIEKSFTADITNETALLSIRDELLSKGVKFDAILDVAGIHRMLSLVESDYSEMKRLIDINLEGTMLVNRVFHSLLKSNGRIVIVTSEVASLAPMPFNGLYNVSKTALECYAQALRQELNLIGQKVITVRPGAIETPLASASIDATERLAASTELYKKQASKFSNIAKRFMGKPMKAEKLAKLIHRATVKKRPRLTYKKHRNAGLVLLGLLPLKLQCAIIKMLLR